MLRIPQYRAKMLFLLPCQMAEKIQYIDRASQKLITEQVPGEGFLRFLYHSPFGKLSLNLVVKRKFLSALFGGFMDSFLSKSWIDSFIDKHQMDLSEYQVPEKGFKTFNDFFYRKLKPGSRKIENGIVSPADGKVVAFESIDAYTSFFVKGKGFTAETFLRDQKLAKKYEGGPMIIIRLAPTDYHRYHFPADGKVSASQLINGDYFSVSPIAMKQSLEIFCENKRVYCIQETEEYGDIMICDVGATMVGSIIQTYTPDTFIKKGDEKGYFAFGGSTLVLFFEKGKVKLSKDLLENTANGIETQVRMGEQIASKS